MVLLKRLELDQIDGAFLYHFSDLPSEYVVHPVAQDRLVLAYPACWDIDIPRSITVEELNQFSAVRLPRSTDPNYYDWQETLFQEIEWRPGVTQWAHGEGTMLGLVASGNGVAIVNERHLSRQSKMIRYTSLDILPQTTPLHFIYKYTSDNPALSTFLQLLSGRE